jgi:predicted nuclease of restriction endonuclease-like (RecB) superfamily
MNKEMGFEELVALFRQTHEVMQQRAARSVNLELVVRNWLFGWYIVEYENGGAERAEIYGKRLVDQLSRALLDVGLKGVSPTNLRKSREFYLAYQKIQQTVSVESFSRGDGTSPLRQAGDVDLIHSSFLVSKELLSKLLNQFELGWSHYVSLLSISDSAERRFYEIEAVQNSWSVRELERQISSSLYERLALSRSAEEVRRLSKEGLVVEKAADVVKDPFVLEFLGLEEKSSYSEEEFERAVIDQLESFLLELGKGFLFEARQKRFTFDNDHFYVDLVFYNRLLRCYVLVDLKLDKLTHQDLGQMQMYVNYFDRYVKTEEELPTLGIVLCSRKNEALVELTLPEDANVFASKYKLYLPSKEELKEQVCLVAESFGQGKRDVH